MAGGEPRHAGQPDAAPTLTILGHVRSTLTDRENAPKSGREGAPEAWIELGPAYSPALLGLEPGQRVLLLTWLHQADRGVLQCQPRAIKSRPLRGVFATRSPDRPNPIGLHEVELREVVVEDGAPARLRVHPLEAIDGTPVVDIKKAG